jgi:hypothetical protein
VSAVVGDAGVRELLAAVLEAIDLPHPATVGDEPAHRELLAGRAMHAAVALRTVLAAERDGEPAFSTAYLRERLAEMPADGYRHWGAR